MHKRDTRLDILRVFACLSVVLIHTYEPLYNNDHLNYPMLFLYAIVGGANTLFFFITGCFWYKDYLESKKFIDVVKKFFISIFLPTFIFSVLFAILDPIIFGYEGRILKLFNPLDFKMIIVGLLTHNFNAISGASLPYWYTFEFLGLLLFYPIIAYLVHKKQNKILIFIVVVSFIQTFIKDICVFPMFTNILSKLTFPFVPNSLAFTILGHLFYNHKDLIFEKTNKYLCLLLVPISIILQVILEIFILRIDRSVVRFFYWDGFLAYIFVIGMFYLVYSFKDNILEKINPIIRYISKRTFYIYLLHFAVYTFLLSSTSVITSIKSINIPIIISLLNGLIVFVISLILSNIPLFIKNTIHPN